MDVPNSFIEVRTAQYGPLTLSSRRRPSTLSWPMTR